eukprot:1138599-Pelagomonas_calceolata.AAC.3
MGQRSVCVGYNNCSSRGSFRVNHDRHGTINTQQQLEKAEMGAPKSFLSAAAALCVTAVSGTAPSTHSSN